MVVVILCVAALLAALGGLATAGLALMPGDGLAAHALIAAPAFGALSAAAGASAAVLAMRRQR